MKFHFSEQINYSILITIPNRIQIMFKKKYRFEIYIVQETSLGWYVAGRRWEDGEDEGRQDAEEEDEGWADAGHHEQLSGKEKKMGRMREGRIQHMKMRDELKRAISISILRSF